MGNEETKVVEGEIVTNTPADIVVYKKTKDEEQILSEMAALMKYDEQKKELTHIDVMSGPMYMRDFNFAYERTARLIAHVQVMYEKAELDSNHEEAKALLERAPKYFEEHNILSKNLKDSAALRQTYLALDQAYIDAKERVGALKALLAWLRNMLESFKMAHDDSKKIYTQFVDGPSGKTGHGGIRS